MKGISAVLLLAAAALVAANDCPSDQATDWTIEQLLRHPVCNKFYKCTFGQPVEMECPENLWFNLDTWQCDWQHNVNCEDRIIPGEEDPEPDEDLEPEVTPPPGVDFLPNGCPSDPHVHWLLPHESNCNCFYYCVWGERVLRECSSDLHFNTRIQVCDWPWRAGCSATRIG